MGHHARTANNDCPVRQSYRAPPPIKSPPHIEAVDVTPSPAAAGPFMVIDDSSPPPTVLSAPAIGAPVIPAPNV
jgi:hypothetical protein